MSTLFLISQRMRDDLRQTAAAQLWCEAIELSQAGVRGKLDFSDQRNVAIKKAGAEDRYRRRIQPVDATHSLNISAGVWKPSVLRGLSFNCLAMALS